MTHSCPCTYIRFLCYPSRHVVNVLQNLTLFGVAIVTMLLTSDLCEAILPMILITRCHWILVTAVALMPLAYVARPKDFW